jgi:hypothetical protein
MLHTLLAAGLSAAALATSEPVQVAPLQAAHPAPTPSAIDPASPPAALVPPATPAPVVCCVLAKLTPVFLKVDEPLDSDKSKIGQRFKLSLAHPLDVAKGVTIPAGTAGAGEVVHAAKSRAMGKAGELVLAARFLDYQGTRIPLRSLRYGKGQGKDNVDTTMWVGLAVGGLITPFITGGEVRIPAGADVWAKVAADVPFAPPAQAPVPAAIPAEIPVEVPTQGVN